MGTRLQELERKLATLPKVIQEQWIERFLAQMDVGRHEVDGKASTEREWIAGRPPSQEQVTEAVEQIVQLSRGKTLGKDTTLKDLIDEGRRR